MEYETVIGLEVHVQLLTESKMFCPCSARYHGSPPNSHVCPSVLGDAGRVASDQQAGGGAHHYYRLGTGLSSSLKPPALTARTIPTQT